MSLEDQQLDFINSATKLLGRERDELERRGHKAIAKGVEIAMTKINVMAVVEWGLPSEKLVMLED